MSGYGFWKVGLLLCFAALAHAEQLHRDDEYLFFGSQLTASEAERVVKVYMADGDDDSDDELRAQRAARFARTVLPKVRITRQLEPLAFERLVAAADLAETNAKDNRNPDAGRERRRRSLESREPAPSTGRRLFSLPEERGDDQEDSLEQDSFVEERAVPIVRGGNGDHKHCESGREVAQLLVDKVPDFSFIHPSLELYFDEEKGTVHFTVEMPYIAFDARYIISFDPIEHAAEEPLLCSSNFDRNITAGPLWTHAPNANYRGAFTSKKDYAAYYTAPDSKWLARSAGCSHVKYAATFSVDELAHCADSDGRFAVAATQQSIGEERSSVSLIGVVWVSLLQPNENSVGEKDTLENAVVAAKWAHPFSITVDARESKIMLVDSANGGIRRRIAHTPTLAKHSRGSTEWPRAATIMRAASVDKDGKLNVVLQTVFATETPASECVARNMTLGQIVGRDFELVNVAALPGHAKDAEGAYCLKLDQGGSTIAQTWMLRSKATQRVYDGDFVLLFCDETTTTPGECDETNAAHRTVLNVRMSAESADTLGDTLAFHSEITQHISPEETKLHAGEFASGQRGCMQTYVIGPKQITSQIEVRLVEAWLCTAPAGISVAQDKEFQCETRPHAVRLAYEDKETRQIVSNAAYNVTVYHPGIYGLLSVGVCFDLNARFVDAANRSLIEPSQRYEARVLMQPATIRRGGPLHVTPLFQYISELAKEVNREYDPALDALASHTKDQSLQARPFVAAVLHATLESARKMGLVSETHGHQFRVKAADADDPVLSETEGAIGIAVVLLLVLCFGIVLHFCVVGSDRMREFSSRIA